MKNTLTLQQLIFVACSLFFYSATAMDDKLSGSDDFALLPRPVELEIPTLGAQAAQSSSLGNALNISLVRFLGVADTEPTVSMLPMLSLQQILNFVRQGGCAYLSSVREYAQRITTLNLSDISKINTGTLRELGRIFSNVHTIIINSNLPNPAGGVFLSVPIAEAIIEAFPQLINLELQDIQFRETTASFVERENAEGILKNWREAKPGRSVSIAYREN